MNFIDAFLNRLTMYRLMLYYLEVLFGAAIVFSSIKLLPYKPLNFILPGLYVIGVCYVANQLFASFFKVKPNFESQFITGLILALIIGPLSFLPNIGFLTLAGVLAMASKYLIAFNKQHIFNPAAFAVFITGILIHQGASWWAGDNIMLPLIIAGGLLVLRKIARLNLVIGFLVASSLSMLLLQSNKIKLVELSTYLVNPATLFFTFVMLTEPITSPANKKLRTYFGVFTGIMLIVYQVLLKIPYSMELSLLSANLVGRIVSFSNKYRFELKEKKEIAGEIWEFLFTPVKPIPFIPGQFLEWSLPHPKADNRGYRRYFTIASSPTEKEIMLAVRVPDKASSYKKALVDLKPGDSIYATNLEGEFVLSNKPDTSYVFVAGGIGITPFRSIIRYMLDNDIYHPVTLFYIAHDVEEFVFDELFEKAKKKFGLQIVHVVSEDPPKDWQGEIGRLTPEMIKKHVPDYKSRIFYLSGPQPMITAYKKLIRDMGVKSANIKTDYFPGYEDQ